ncbi:acyltransferase family protein [Burkholderia ubonensis]|uniref:acyltransferase family protein n=1 Tax=Burkholderia ubonensis TaxID=101571 RepID=UPI0008FDEEB3|nr:acyltransferase [Burkholderia ubonensis]
MSKTYQRLPSLTTGRGIAALMVAVHHACLAWGGILTPVGNVGWLGVAYFYILSGFVLAWSWSPERPTSEFYMHRIARVYPLHVITLALSLTAFWLLGSPLAGYVGNPAGTIAQLFLVHDWLPGHPNVRQAWNGVSWSLSAEFGFYLCAPALLKWSAKARTATLVNVAAALYLLTTGIGVGSAAIHSDRISDFMLYHPVARLPEFIYGIVAARLLQRGAEISTGPLLKLAAFMPIAIYVFGNDHRNPVAMVSLCAPAFLLFIVSGATDDIKGKSSVFTHRLLQLVGEASFSLYMTHALLLGVTVGAARVLHIQTHAIILTTVFLAASVALSIVFYKFVELPLRRFILSRARPGRPDLRPARVGEPGTSS